MGDLLKRRFGAGIIKYKGTLTKWFIESTSGQLTGMCDNVTDLEIYDDLVGVVHDTVNDIVTITLDSDLLDGDAILDGTVDGLDLAAWEANYGTPGAGWTGADFEGDGDTDGLDFLRWQLNLGAVAAFASESQVPEPTTSARATS